MIFEESNHADSHVGEAVRATLGYLASQITRVAVHLRSEGPGEGSADLPNLAAVLASQRGGSIYVLQPDDIPAGAEAAAMLHY